MALLIVVLILAAALLIGAFARLYVLRREWRESPPPTYKRPYRRWDEEEDGKPR